MADEIQDVNGVDGARLLSYIERIEHIEEEKKALQNDIKEIYEEAKSANFDVKAIKQLLKIRKWTIRNARKKSSFWTFIKERWGWIKLKRAPEGALLLYPENRL